MLLERIRLAFEVNSPPFVIFHGPFPEDITGWKILGQSLLERFNESIQSDIASKSKGFPVSVRYLDSLLSFEVC